MATEFAGNVVFNDRHAVHLLLHQLLLFQLVVFAEVLDVFRVDEVFWSRILVVVFLEVVDFIFVFVVAVMAWAEAEIGEFDSLCFADGVFGKGDGSALVPVVEFDDSLDCFVLLFLCDVFRALVFEAVGFEDVFGRPIVARVVVV